MVTAACRVIGISPSTAYLERERNERFAGDWDAIRSHVVRPSLEDEAWRRAVEGVEKRVVSAGQDLGTETVYSDTLLTLLLKANLPEKYRERVDVAHSGGTSVQVTRRVDLSKLSDEQLDALDAIEDALKGDGAGA